MRRLQSSYVCAAGGRVSDTMGGACMGVFMVSAAAYVCKAVRA